MNRSLESIKITRPRWIIFLFFIITGILFNFMMILTIYSHKLSTGLIFFIMINSIIYFWIFSLPSARKRKDQCFILFNELLSVHMYRKKCLYLYQMQGFSKFRWYVLYWIGPLWMVASLFISFSMNSQEISFWIVVMGLLGWCIFFKLQVRRECRWCYEAGPIHIKFINKIIIIIFIWYAIVWYVPHTYEDSWPEFLQTISTVVFPITQSCFSSLWLFLCLGQRGKRDVLGNPLRETEGDGRFDQSSPYSAISPSERKKIFMVGRSMDSILIIMLLGFLLYLVYWVCSRNVGT